MKMKVEHIPASPLIYMRRTGPYGEENFKLMQTMKDWIKKQGLGNEGGTIYGIAQDNPSIVPPEECRYDVCFVTQQVFKDNMVHRGTLPAGTYLTCEILHTTEAVQHFWASLADVLEESAKELDQSRPILERYQFARIEKGYCEFCIPVLDSLTLVNGSHIPDSALHFCGDMQGL